MSDRDSQLLAASVRKSAANAAFFEGGATAQYAANAQESGGAIILGYRWYALNLLG
ncbi:MAG: hypothetical protein II336_14350 [Loktanella sp.]|nr:hypothetical protein [Loktanella sp.]